MVQYLARIAEHEHSPAELVAEHARPLNVVSAADDERDLLDRLRR